MFLMGKAKSALLRERYGPNPCNLNPSNDLLREYTRAQKWVVRKKHAQTVVLRKLRRYQRDLVAKKRRALKIVAFGYWKYWFIEGKIGPDEEDNEPNLRHD
jgi:hypothetical protein